MAIVASTNDQRKTYPGKINRVVGIAKIDWYAFEFTNSEGKADVGFAATFGKDHKDGLLHIAVIEPQVLKDLLKEPHRHIRDGIRALLGQHAAPADLPVSDLSEAGFAPGEE